ncbi:MAG: efflux RND transporter permease subunit [Gemmataceae bacterium]|nr:efflux RND transporter permease subunit [Gemmataceae bacterium]
MFSHLFIDRPIFATVLSIVIVIVGTVALTKLPIAQYPEVAPPTITVTANYPGANAKVVADTVATPIEQEVNGVENMIYMSSRCTNDGQMLLAGQGAGAEMPTALSVAVFSGMLGVTIFGILFTPVFYVVIRRFGGKQPVARTPPVPSEDKKELATISATND